MPLKPSSHVPKIPTIAPTLTNQSTVCTFFPPVPDDVAVAMIGEGTKRKAKEKTSAKVKVAMCGRDDDGGRPIRTQISADG